MEREPQFFKTSEKPVQKVDEVPEGQKQTEKEEIFRSEDEKRLKIDLEAKEKAEKEKGEFFNKMQHQEQEMVGGILRKVTETSPKLRKTIMILATASVFLSAGKVFAGGEHWQRTYEGWQKNIRQVEATTYQQKAIERYKVEAIQHQYQLKERARFDAYQEYKKQIEIIQKTYEQRKFDIMIGRIEGATDYFGKQKAYQELEQWRYNEEMKARQNWYLKVWAAEETYRQEYHKIQQWR